MEQRHIQRCGGTAPYGWGFVYCYEGFAAADLLARARSRAYS